MRSRFSTRTKAPLLLALTAVASTSMPTTANAGLIAVSLVYPIYTPTCPVHLSQVTGSAGTGVTGIIYVVLIETISVAFTYDTPVNQYTVSPIVGPAENDPSGVEYTLTETNIQSGSYLVAATHTWVSLGGFPQTEYTNDYKYLPANP